MQKIILIVLLLQLFMNSYQCFAANFSMHHMQSYLDAAATGSWDKSFTLWNTSAAIRPYQNDPNLRPVLLGCLKGRWIALIGDSSTRMLNAAIAQAINGYANTQYFGDSNNHLDKGACSKYDKRAQWQNGVCDMISLNTCLLDLNAHETRLSFNFHTCNKFIPTRVVSLFMDELRPDIIVVETGPWAHRGGYSPEALAIDAVNFLRDVSAISPHSLFIWLSFNVCIQGASAANRAILEAVHNYARETPALRILFLNRHSSTHGVSNTRHRRLCESYHAYGEVAALHANMLLNAICSQETA